MTIERVPNDERYLPKAEISRRAMALSLDFFAVWLISSLLGSNSIGIQFTQILVFICSWLVFRVLVVYNNRGQSLGRWAFDTKVLEANEERIRIPDLLSLFKRESIIGACALLVSIALGNIWTNPTAILLVIPLIVDCGAAISDKQYRFALHDRYAGTMIVSSERGYSLDLKVKRIVDSFRRNVRR